MKLNRVIVILLLENTPDWATSPNGLLDFIVMVDHLSINGFTNADWEMVKVTSTTIELGESFLKAIPLKLEPYQNFRELSKTFRSTDHLKEKMSAIIKMILEDQQLHDLSKQTGITPSRETIAAEKAMRIIANTIIDKWSVYVEFTD